MSLVLGIAGLMAALALLAAVLINYFMEPIDLEDEEA